MTILHRKKNINTLRREIEHIHLCFIITFTILFCFAGAYFQVQAHDKALDQNLKDNGELIRRLYAFVKDKDSVEMQEYFDELVKKLSDVDVLSIVDTKDIRIYHTNHSLIGTIYNGRKPFVGDTNYEPYAEDATGPSGDQRRTYSAIYDEDGNYCGFVMTIMLKTSIRTIVFSTYYCFLFITAFAILIELFISKKISETIKKKLMGFEPDVISAMYMIRERILETIYDGIISVDKNKNVLFLNKAAQKILNYESKEKDEDKEDFNEDKSLKDFVEKYFTETLKNSGESQHLQECSVLDKKLIIDCVPIKKEGNLIGAVGILHDRTEYTKLMEELAGTKYLVDSMRANNHDFTNKLHVILGLIQIGQQKKAVSYIENISFIQRETLSTIMKAIDKPAFAALLVGKIARASECNVKFVLKEGLHFKSEDVDIHSEALITICGNLIDNAIDAMNIRAVADSKMKELVFGVFTRPHALLITVEDSGCGIAEENKDKIFTKGFSTKGSGRGVGLYHTKQLVESLGGKISFESMEGVGTSFMVVFKGNENV